MGGRYREARQGSDTALPVPPEPERHGALVSGQVIMVKLSTVIPVIVANSLLWGWLLLALAESVLSLYARGYGRPSAVLLYVAMPLGGLLVSLGLPSWLCYIERRNAARWIAWLCLLCLWPAYFLLIVAPAAAI